jgi:hypothetical protein
MTTLEEIVSKATPYFDYVFKKLEERYKLEIRWELNIKPDVDSTLVGAGEKLIREKYELKIYIIGKGTIRVNGITRYYIELEKSRRREYLGFRLATFEEIEDKIERFL